MLVALSTVGVSSATASAFSLNFPKSFLEMQLIVGSVHVVLGGSTFKEQPADLEHRSLTSLSTFAPEECASAELEESLGLPALANEASTGTGSH